MSLDNSQLSDDYSLAIGKVPFLKMKDLERNIYIIRHVLWQVLGVWGNRESR